MAAAFHMFNDSALSYSSWGKNETSHTAIAAWAGLIEAVFQMKGVFRIPLGPRGSVLRGPQSDQYQTAFPEQQ